MAQVLKEGDRTDSERLRSVTDFLINFEHRVWVRAQERGLTKKDLQVTAEILHKVQDRAISRARELESQDDTSRGS